MVKKEQNYPSIFNDVIGPVMRGPSSSHCAAAVRIGRLARDLMGGEINNVLIEFDSHGSLASTHASQGSDMGLFGGFLGWEAMDERLVDSATALQAAGVKVTIEIKDLGDAHPNTYRMTLQNAQEEHHMMAISTGGGMIEVIGIDGLPLSIHGDYYETLLFLSAGGQGLVERLRQSITADEIRLHKSASLQIIQIKAQHFLDDETLASLNTNYEIRYSKRLSPVLPVLSHKDIQIPFITCQEMLAYNGDRKLALWQLALHYEAARGDISHQQVFEQMKDIVSIMQDSIQRGIAGTRYADRILGYQSGAFRDQMEAGHLLDGGLLNRMILYTSAMMEVKSSMGVIVAAPTAGACGGLPGAVIGAAGEMELSIDEMTKAMLAAGMIGVFIAAHATFAAEVGGCQAECGAGSGMAAAALVTLADGSARQAVEAASMALQNIFGLVCDPIANRVEAPCLGRNVMAASNALACANMSLAGYDPVIPLDETIQAMDAVGKSLPYELRCTALGGLSVTPTSKAIEKRLG
ncbi:L-serine ammonia-lyase, iron-sulfur-dependent, subunit alpha [Chloroflexota bacterium]